MEKETIMKAVKSLDDAIFASETNVDYLAVLCKRSALVVKNWIGEYDVADFEAFASQVLPFVRFYDAWKKASEGLHQLHVEKHLVESV